MRLRVEDICDGLFSTESVCRVVAVDRTEIVFLSRANVRGDTILCDLMKMTPEGAIVEVLVTTNEAVRRFVVDPDLLEDGD